MIRIFRNHFAGMFSSTHAPDPTFEDRVLDFCSSLPQVLYDFGMGLTGTTSLSELERMLRRMKTGSTPGPNGLPTEFCRSFRPDIGPVLVCIFNNFLATGVFPVSFHSSHVVLLPKPDGDPSQSQSWRPILLLNSDYKLFSSLLVARLHDIMPQIVHSSQKCSVPGWSIFSSLSRIRGLFVFAACIGLKGPFVGPNQAKVFDPVEPDDYLFAVLAAFGFPPSFVVSYVSSTAG